MNVHSLSKLTSQPQIDSTLDRQTQILDAALICFAKRGFHQASMHDISAEAGISVGLIYRYFENKEAVISAMADRHKKEIYDMLERARQAATLLESLEILFTAHCCENEPRVISAFEITLRPTSSRERSKSARARFKSASAVCSCASSADASSWTNKSPFLATPPFSNAIWLTTPPSSAETTAPCIGEIEPTAESIGAQSSSFTVTLETVVGGITFGVDAILTICSPLIPTSRMTRAIKPPIATPQAPPTDLTLGLVETGLAISCICWFGFISKQEPPQSPCDFQLAGAPFRRGHLLRLQNIAHQHSARDSKNKFCEFIRL